MKLIFCNKCQDVVRLNRYEARTCYCKESSGKYIDELNAWYKGDCIPLGFVNSSLSIALKNQPEDGCGVNFDAFVIPKECPTFKKI